MKIPTPETIQRPELMSQYVDMQVAYLCRMTGKPESEIRPKVMAICQSRYKPKKLKYFSYPSYGNRKVVDQDLLTFIHKTQNTIVAPAGSFYKPPYIVKSIVSQMVIDKLAERKKIKKIQLKAEGAGDEVLAKRCWYQQATIKINCNSLPGGFGSAFNIFYDKPNYNSITSTARCMIARAYTVCEQLLGGNFAWFSVEELINHVLINLRNMPPRADIQKCITKYRLKLPTKEMLYKFYEETLRQYCPVDDLKPIADLVDKLDQDEVTFLFYLCNLRHIMWLNEDVFKPYLKHVFNLEDVAIDENVTKDDAFAIDETITTVTTVAFAEQLGSYGLVDICNDHPEYIPKLVAYSKATEKRLKSLDLLMETFVNTTAETPEFQKKPMTWRNTTIVSDTDSVIFTADAWDTWYRNGRLDIDQESYQIASLVIYWLHHAVKFALLRFSVAYGVTGDAVTRLAMKNEFLFSVMMTYPIKKTYISIQRVQEGVVLPKPKPDLKGQTLRGSSICAPALAFAEEIMLKEILEPVTKGKISGNAIIQKVVDFENHIAETIQARQLDFLKVTSLKYERDYKNPGSTSVFVAWTFWQQVFADKYGEMFPPAKVKIFKVVPPTQEYWDWLEQASPEIFKRMRKYVLDHKTFPKQLIVNPSMDELPMEMIQLVDIREIIWHNIQPVYSTLKRINIAIGCEKQKLLLSDIY